LTTAGGLLAGKNGGSGVRGIVCQLRGDVIGAVDGVVDENTAADVAGGAMPNTNSRRDVQGGASRAVVTGWLSTVTAVAV
jgi:hypothetical protein